MLKFIKKYGFTLLIVLALLFPFAFYTSDLSGRRDLSLAERILYSVSRPLETVVHWLGSGSRNVWSSYVDLRNARRDADALRLENTRLKLEMQAQSELGVENSRLRQLLSLVQRSDLRFRSCEIVSADPSFVFRNIRIACGEKEGMIPGMGVVSAEGVVGIIMRVYGSFSDVLLVTDPNSNLDVIVARNRRRGILQGRGTDGGMIFKYADRGTRIQVGDEIISSGLTGPFPAGLAVGRVSRIDGEGELVSANVEVEPSMNIYQMSEVLVLVQPGREIDVIRRVGGDEWMRRVVEDIGRSGG